MAVFVLDKQKRPLMPCTEKRARLLLERGCAVVVRLAPFTIRLKDRIGGAVQPLRLKLDPGSRTTGLALVRESETIDPDTGAVERVAHVLWLGELTHRGHQIREALTARAAFRRRRRTANLRHRAPRFDNRTKPTGWLAPSLRHPVVRARGIFNLQTAAGVADSLSHRHCRVLQRANGYGYAFNPKTPTEDARRVP